MSNYLFQVTISYSDASVVDLTVDVTEKEHVLLARDEAIALITESNKYDRPPLTITSVAAVEASRV